MIECTQTITVPPASIVEVAAVCARAIAAGGLIVLPTDTVYGLACDPRNPAAIARIYEAKGRPAELALPVLVASAEDAAPLVAGEPYATARRLFARFCRVPHHCHPSRVNSPPWRPRRLPRPARGASELARAIIAACGGALAATSANASGGAPARTPADCRQTARARGGGGGCRTMPGRNSLDRCGPSVEPPQMLRAGPITIADIQVVLPEIVTRREEPPAMRPLCRHPVSRPGGVRLEHPPRR